MISMRHWDTTLLLYLPFNCFHSVAFLMQGISYKEPKMPAEIILFSIRSRPMCFCINSHGLWNLCQCQPGFEPRVMLLPCLLVCVFTAREGHETERGRQVDDHKWSWAPSLLLPEWRCTGSACTCWRCDLLIFLWQSPFLKQCESISTVKYS